MSVENFLVLLILNGLVQKPSHDIFVAPNTFTQLKNNFILFVEMENFQWSFSHENVLWNLVIFNLLNEFSWGMKNIGGRIASPSFSAVGPIWLGPWLEWKIDQKRCAAMSFSYFSLNYAGGIGFNKFHLDIPSFW